MTVLATLAIVAAGVLLAKALLDRDSNTASWPTAFVLGPAVGFGGLSILYFLWRLCDLQSSHFGLPAWGLVVGGLILGARQALRSTIPGRSHLEAAKDLLPIALAGVGVALMVAGVFFYSRQMPNGTFDAVAIWTARARLLHLGQDLPQLLDLVRGGHPDYPLLLPGSLAAQFAMTGTLSPHLTQATGAIFALSAAGALALGVVHLGGSRRWALLAAALLLTTPRFLYWGSAQCADVPLSYLWVVTVTALATLVAGSRPLVPATLAGYLLGLLAWTKNEGLPLTALLVVLFVAAMLLKGRRATLRPFLLGAAVPWLAVALFRALWKPRTDLHFFVGDLFSRVLEPARWQTVAEAFSERLLPWKGFGDWGLVWLLAGLVLACTAIFVRPANPTLRVARWALAFCWFAWFGIFVGTPVDLDWHLRTALDRLLLQLLPLTLMVAFAGIGARRSDSTATD